MVFLRSTYTKQFSVLFCDMFFVYLMLLISLIIIKFVTLLYKVLRSRPQMYKNKTYIYILIYGFDLCRRVSNVNMIVASVNS